MTPTEEKDLAVADVLKRLDTAEGGLESSEAARRLRQFGPNEIAEEKRSAIIAFLRYFWGPIAWMIEAAAVLSALVRPWADFGIIVNMLVDLSYGWFDPRIRYD